MTEFSEIIPIASDHAGFTLKEYLKKILGGWGYQIEDYGTDSEESMDYPDAIHPLAKAINEGKYRRGIILCGSGNGAAMVANKYQNVRAAICWEEEITKLARLHNDANIIAIPARFISNVHASELVHLFLITEFEGGRHERRIQKIPVPVR